MMTVGRLAVTILGRAIKRLRTERGMTQDALGQWCGVSRQTVVSMEHGGPVARG